ncbi:FG-GAP-like repeat-containing protein [Polyangium sp. 15x6]|uniref:FG-GAP repeat protein n=1 Tax=Polyangium sp. 15x6 TaxID=3042687 RepID=UPI00249C7C6F|nr:FG-GAP-like repeat-containing protein [Polyangium sp. 15x6]
MSRISRGDVDGDGRLDVVTWRQFPGNAGRPRIFVGTTVLDAMNEGAVLVEDAFDLSEIQSYITSPTRTLGDVDRDGCADLVVASYASGGVSPTKVYLLSGDCAGRFAPKSDVPLGHAPGLVAEIPMPANQGDLGDVDGDGLLDLVLAPDDDGDPGQVWLLRGDGRGFRPPEAAFDVLPAIEHGQDRGGSGGLSLIDWNGDGLLDADVTYDPVPRTTADMPAKRDIHLGDGTGRFVMSATVSVVIPVRPPPSERSR